MRKNQNLSGSSGLLDRPDADGRKADKTDANRTPEELFALSVLCHQLPGLTGYGGVLLPDGYLLGVEAPLTIQ